MSVKSTQKSAFEVRAERFANALTTEKDGAGRVCLFPTGEKLNGNSIYTTTTGVRVVRKGKGDTLTLEFADNGANIPVNECQLKREGLEKPVPVIPPVQEQTAPVETKPAQNEGTAALVPAAKVNAVQTNRAKAPAKVSDEVIHDAKETMRLLTAKIASGKMSWADAIRSNEGRVLADTVRASCFIRSMEVTASCTVAVPTGKDMKAYKKAVEGCIAEKQCAIVRFTGSGLPAVMPYGDKETAEKEFASMMRQAAGSRHVSPHMTLILPDGKTREFNVRA